MKFYFAGRSNTFESYVDFDINTDNPNQYYVLTYDGENNYWYAMKRVCPIDFGDFEDGGEATRAEVAAMLATMPVNELPASALLGGLL